MNDKHTAEKEFETMLIRALDEYAAEQGRVLGEEVYPQPHYSKEYERNIKYILKGKKNVRKSSRMMHWGRIAACVMVFVLTSGSLTYNANARFRLFINRLFNEKEDYVKIGSYVNDMDYDFSSIPESWDFFSVPEYLPEGYTVKELNAINNRIIITYTYYDDGEEITYIEVNNVDFVFTLDSDRSNYVEIAIKGNDGFYLTTDYDCTLIWTDGMHKYYLHKQNAGAEELIEIAQSLKRFSN